MLLLSYRLYRPMSCSSLMDGASVADSAKLNVSRDVTTTVRDRLATDDRRIQPRISPKSSLVRLNRAQVDFDDVGWHVLHNLLNKYKVQRVAEIRNVSYRTTESHSVAGHPTEVNASRRNPRQTRRYAIYLSVRIEI